MLKSINKSSIKINNSSNSKTVTTKSATETPQTSTGKRKEKTTCFVPNVQQCILNKKPGELTMSEKLQVAAPYNLFFTRIPESPETLKQPNSVQITDLLCPSLGNLKCSLQINFMIDIMWLMEQYEAQRVG